MSNLYIQVDNTLPTHCPACGKELKWVGVDLVCDDKECPNMKESDLQQWCEVIGETDGLQWTLMKQYLDEFNIRSVDDLYEKQKTLLYAYDSSKNPNLSITDKKFEQFLLNLFVNSIRVERALKALNIPRLGDKTSKLLAKYPQLVDEVFHYAMAVTSGEFPSPATENYIEQGLLNTVKEATTKTILDNLDRLSRLQYIYFKIDATGECEKEVKYIAVTGSLETMKRKDFETFISKYGYELTTNLKKCECLVNNDITSTSSKNKQAKEYNIPIVTEKEFLKKFEKF